MFFIVNVARGLLLFIALFLPMAITEEEFNFCIEYESNPKLFYKYFFISIKRNNWLSVNFIENTGSIVVLPRLNEPSPSINPKSQLLDILTCFGSFLRSIPQV